MKILNTEYRILNRGKTGRGVHSVFSIRNSVFGLLAEVNIGESFTFQDDAKAIDTFKDFGALVTQWLPNVYVAGGIILFFMVLGGGFSMVMNAGNQEKLQQGNKVLTSALVGFGILFGSYWIIQIIQVLTGVPILGSGL